MKVTDAEIVISAVSQKQYPDSQFPEIAFAGRSNVGKSSLINTIAERKNLARTSSTPGKTQTINFYKINDAFYFADVPGYGYAKVSKQEREKWRIMMEEYFETRDALKACVLITDARHAPTDNDAVMYDFLKYYELPVIVIASKIDKITKGKRAQHIKQTHQTLEVESDDVLIPFSARTGEGKDDIWRAIRPYIERRS